MGEYLREILTVLGSAFPEALLLTEEASGGFRTPCILVQKQELVLRQEMGKRYRREETFLVTLFTGEKDLFFSESQGEKLAQLLAGLPSGKKAELVKLKCSSEQARLTAVYCSIAFQKETEGEKMSHEKVRMAVKGSK